MFDSGCRDSNRFGGMASQNALCPRLPAATIARHEQTTRPRPLHLREQRLHSLHETSWHTTATPAKTAKAGTAGPSPNLPVWRLRGLPSQVRANC